MPTWGRRGSYVGATSVMVALVAVGVFVQCNRTLIPPPDNNDLAGFKSRFLNRASRQGIDWRTTEQQPFAEAARLGKPVMVFAGTAASQAARRNDDEVFSNPEVWARLNRDFVCVRVDLGTEPEWRSALLPVLRNQVGADPGFAVWFFKPNGQLLTWMGRRAWEDTPDYNDFLGSLAEIKQQFVTSPEDTWTQSEREQHEEYVRLRQVSTRSLPDIDAYFATLDQPSTFFQWQAGKYRALLQAQRTEQARLSLRRDLSTPRADLVDGGFFRLGSGNDPMQVEFDKLATVNAEMLAVLARAHANTGDPLVAYWYRRTVECLKEQFMAPDEWSSYVENTIAEDGRSFRNSFSVADTRTKLDSTTRSYLHRLGLDARTNPLMAPYLVDPDASLQDEDLLALVVGSLRRATDSSRLLPAKDKTLDAAGLVVARTLEAAWVMDDQDTIKLALQWAEGLREFRAGTDEVNHSTFGRGLSRKWLGDFAAYADAMLFAFAATGDESWLDDGELVLRRALELFRHDEPGDLVAVAGSMAATGPLKLDMPSIVDDGPPPALPSFMSVCFRYGAVLGDKDLRQIAVDVAERFSSAANQAPTAFSSFFASALEVVETGCVVTNVPVNQLTWPHIVTLRSSARNRDVPPGAAARYVRTESSLLSIPPR